MAPKPNPDDMLEGLEGLGAEDGAEVDDGGEDSDSVAAAGDILDAFEAKDAGALDSALKAWLALADSAT